MRAPSRPLLATIGGALFATCLVLGTLVSNNPPTIDVWFVEAFRGEHDQLLGQIIKPITDVFGPALALTLMVTLVFGFGYYTGLGDDVRAGVMVRAALVLGLSWAVVQLKGVFVRTRPRVFPGESFPSGHVTAVTAVTVTVVVLIVWSGRELARWVPGALAFVVLLAASCRVMLGVHYLTDVVGGFVGALGVGLLVSAAVWPPDKGVLSSREPS
ncbi:phosphatase PAP2 family protein [Allokutzneria albata]|uniref:Undecaprenyl-diphosphatase n=1 Tax=Allokutzneria albata TaxID=211114 RepID=A0A1H0CMR7_ALLAB|nr:phosphatase PAP2 family protein [Allokutzneria albata]SDN59189.1 undecaprenyl-diphosphatase [Allokutzneria albata]